MKLRISFSVVMLLFTCNLFAQQARFDEATNLLEEQKYMEAIEAYRSIANDGHVSGALWLNMGVAYARVDSLGKAKYYLLRAEQFSDTERLARQSLEVVNNRFSRRSAVLPLLPWDRFFNWTDATIGSLGLMVIGLVLLNLSAGFVLAMWFHPRLKTLYRYLGITAGGMATLFLALSFYIDLQKSWYDTGVTVERQATVRDKPDPQSTVISTAYEGYTMRVDLRESDSFDGWHYIRLENGLYGWIEEDAIMAF